MSVTTLISFEITHYHNLQISLQILQNAESLLQNPKFGFITKCFTLYYIMRTLLQNAAMIIKKMRYYKMSQNTGDG